ncbi:MAG TPA: sugar transferase [Balneolaceae bacterium]|nr:sugar transferase [Balneolaceae bacterium]
MSADVEVEQKGERRDVDRGEFPTVRDNIDQELEAVQKSSEGRIYEMHRYFEGFASDKLASRILVDGVFGFVVFVIFIVLYPFIALGIKLTSKGPVIYKQRRTGQNGHPFICYKFRTMRQIDLHRIDGRPTVTQNGDKRIFGFGKILRRLSLDELPQIINVFQGDMSLIGPRPYELQECSFWNNKFDDFYFRYAAKPGITGLAQINGYRGGTLDEEHMRRRLDYDLIYAKKASLKLDLYILGKTFEEIIFPKSVER